MAFNNFRVVNFDFNFSTVLFTVVHGRSMGLLHYSCSLFSEENTNSFFAIVLKNIAIPSSDCLF
jgi:hypothetical protein